MGPRRAAPPLLISRAPPPGLGPVEGCHVDMLARLVVALEVGALAPLAGGEMHDVASTGAAGHDVDSGVRVLDLVAALTVEAKPAKLSRCGYTGAGHWAYSLCSRAPDRLPNLPGLSVCLMGLLYPLNHHYTTFKVLLV